MNAQPQRNENSVQMSLSQLRDLHTARIETTRHMEEQRAHALEAQRMEAERARLAEERKEAEQREALAFEREAKRLAAERELELSKERARIEAEAKVREKQLELQLKLADSEMLKTQAMASKPRSWLGLALVAGLLLALQAGLFYQQRRSTEDLEDTRTSMRETQRDSYDAAKSLRSLERELTDARTALTGANDRVAALEQRLQALEHTDKPTTRTATRPRPTSSITRPPANEPGPVQATCLDSPLCAN